MNINEFANVVTNVMTKINAKCILGEAGTNRQPNGVMLGAFWMSGVQLFGRPETLHIDTVSMPE